MAAKGRKLPKPITVKGCHMSGTDHYCIPDDSDKVCKIYPLPKLQGVPAGYDMTVCVSSGKVSCYLTPPEKRPVRKSAGSAKPTPAGKT